MSKLWCCGILIAAPLVLLADESERDSLVAESVRLRALTPSSGPHADLKRPDWTRFENLLRDWMESQLPPSLPMLEAAFPSLEASLTAELWRSGVFEPEKPSAVVGYVASLKILRPAEYPNVLIIESGVSVGCGTDVSFYLYRFTSSGRERIVEEHGKGSWGNQIMEARFSAPDPVGNRMLYLSWDGVQCASVWNLIEYRVIRLGPSAERANIVLSGDHSFVIDDDVHVKIAPDELLLELTAEAMEGGFRRTYVLRFNLSGEGVTRNDPVALQPQDFVHEWLLRPWGEMQSRSSPTVAKWHAFLHSDSVFGEYEFVQACKERSGITQVAVGLHQIGEREAPEPVTIYFLVEDKGDHLFSMSEVSLQRQPGCPGESYATYENPPSLFPKQ